MNHICQKNMIMNFCYFIDKAEIFHSTFRSGNKLPIVNFTHVDELLI